MLLRDSTGRSVISIHALLAESDYDSSVLMKCQVKFLSTLSLRRATRLLCYTILVCLYFYPRSPCGERHPVLAVTSEVSDISIHALLAESDPLIFNVQPRKTISIHALLAESDYPIKYRWQNQRQFLSTLSLRRATT